MKPRAWSSSRALRIAGLVVALAAASAGVSMAQTQTTGSVEIAWDANLTDADLASYKVYADPNASLFSGPPSAAQGAARKITVGKTVTDQILTGLDASRVWYFAVTSIDASGNESVFSNVVSAQPSVAPIVLSVSPNSAEQGQTGRAVTVTGSDFVGAGTSVDFGPGITVTALNTSGAPSTLVATISVDRLAQVNSRSVVVTNPGGGTGTRASAFTVTVDVTRLDMDGSGRIDAADFVDILLGFPSVSGSPYYNVNRDVDSDGKIDGADLAIFFAYFGTFP